jgi:long-chain acyl-CoA synthetase
VGYWDRPADSARLLRGGWLHTGDNGRIDDQGHLWYMGRLPEKELIKTGGENVYPAEIEAVILEHPEIAEVVVIGVPDPRWGEAIQAVCVAKSKVHPTQEELAEFVGDRIARYKRPRIVVFVEALPKKADGSVDRKAIMRGQLLPAEENPGEPASSG